MEFIKNNTQRWNHIWSHTSGRYSLCRSINRAYKNKIDISKIDKDIFDISFADFFNIKENGEFSYKNKESARHFP